jgi:hypothetical protein
MWTILVVPYTPLLEKTEPVRRSISQQQGILRESPGQKSSCQFSRPQASKWIFLRGPAPGLFSFGRALLRILQIGVDIWDE